MVRPAVECLRLLALTLLRRRWHGRELMPPLGEPVIIVANHLSHTDPVSLTHFILKTRDRLPRFLIKHSLFKVPVVRNVLTGARQIPVYRNTTTAAQSLEAALAALDEGELVLIYPEGTTTKRADHLPGLGKPGAARLALLSGAPVMPLVHWGEQRLFGNDRTVRLFARPVSEVRLLPALDLSRWQGAEVTQQAVAEVTELITTSLTEGVLALRAAA